MSDELFSLENIFAAWHEFKKGKQAKSDVQIFERFLEDNIFALHGELENKTYRHGHYGIFHICDPKHRVISKATVRDRLVHHLVFKKLYNIFDPEFIFHSYSSRENKGTHLAVKNFSKCLRRESKNDTRTVYVLKCDIKKFFQSISHKKLLQLIERKISDKNLLWLIEEIINSFFKPVDNFRRERERERAIGVPIGNITSQIFANIYLNELDWFIKRELKIKNYFRYADDLVTAHLDASYLKKILSHIDKFLQDELKLELHPNKISITKFHNGIDFLGYVIFPDYKALRTKTKRRMFKKIKVGREKLEKGLIDDETFNQSLQSYYGMLKHCNGHKLKIEVDKIVKNF